MRTAIQHLMLCLLAGLTQALYGQLAPSPGGGETAAMAQAMTAVSGNIWAQSLNPAGIAGSDSALQHLRVGISMQRPLLVPELSTAHVAATYPLTGTHFIGAEISTYGFNAFRQSTISVSYAGWFMQKLSVGSRLVAHNLLLEDLGSAWAVSLDAGLQYRLSKRTTLGAAIQNANRGGYRTLAGSTERIATTLRLGVAYQPSDKVTVSGDWVQAAGQKPGGAAGVSYRPAKALAIRAGMGTHPQRWGLGISMFAASALRIDMAFVYAAQSGGSPALSAQLW